jgi:hypothetical protein
MSRKKTADRIRQAVDSGEVEIITTPKETAC